MSVISGVISRQVLPFCGSLCFFCPAMRARSRQPVKRYKKLLTDIFQVCFFNFSNIHAIFVLLYHRLLHDFHLCGANRLCNGLVV